MPRVDQIEEADAEKLYPLAVTFGNNGTSATLNIKYRALTTEMSLMPTVAEVLAATIAEWDLLDNEDRPIKPSLEYLAARPLPFVAKILEAINADFRPAKGK